MNINKQIISTLDCLSDSQIMISDSIIDVLNLGFTTYQYPVLIKNSSIQELVIHSAWFKGGLLLENCIIKEVINYEMGGHNESPIVINDNIFQDLFIFYDCHFQDKLIIRNNIFNKGSTLLIEKLNIFQSGLELNDNIGDMYKSLD